MKPPLDYNIEPYLEWILNCQIGELSEIKKMLESGYDINTRDDDGFSGLHHSIEEEEYETSFYLIDNGIEITMTDLKMACNKENRDLVERMIIEINFKEKQGIEEVFMDFVFLCSYEFLEWYVKKFEPDVNYVGNHQLTALSEVATSGDLKKFKFLLERGADIKLIANNGLNTIEWCQEVKDNDGVKEIIKEIKTATNKTYKQ